MACLSRKEERASSSDGRIAQAREEARNLARLNALAAPVIPVLTSKPGSRYSFELFARKMLGTAPATDAAGVLERGSSAL